MTGRADDDVDLVVVGAGPAGATTALAALRADPGLRVLLLDRADFPRDKCCGDGVAAQAVEVLAGLGAADVVDGWAPLRTLDLASGEASIEGRLAHDMHVVPRSVLDARLVDHAVARGARLERRRVTTLDVRDDGVVLDGAIRARVVVGADGAHSRVRAVLAEGSRLPRPRRAIALRGYAPTPTDRAGRQVIRYGPHRQPSYAWAFDRGDGWSNVGYGELVGEGRRTSRDRLLAELESLLPGAASDGGDWSGHPLPLSAARWHHPDGRCLLVGDAAGLVNPMTGEGIYYAVATGAIAGATAAEAVGEGSPDSAGARHRRRVRRLLAAHLRHTWAAGLLSRRPEVVAAGIRAAAADPRAFDALVELGLGGGRITPSLARGLGSQLLLGATSRRLVPAPPG